jgi:hypothetical protein
MIIRPLRNQKATRGLEEGVHFVVTGLVAEFRRVHARSRPHSVGLDSEGRVVGGCRGSPERRPHGVVQRLFEASPRSMNSVLQESRHVSIQCYRCPHEGIMTAKVNAVKMLTRVGSSQRGDRPPDQGLPGRVFHYTAADPLVASTDGHRHRSSLGRRQEGGCAPRHRSHYCRLRTEGGRDPHRARSESRSLSNPSLDRSRPDHPGMALAGCGLQGTSNRRRFRSRGRFRSSTPLSSVRPLA